MCKLKLRFRYAPPPLDRTGGLPLLLGALLLAAAAFQLCAADDTDLPPPGRVAAGGTAGRLPPPVAPATGGAAILARSVFTPVMASAAAAGAGGGQPDITLVGSIRVGRTLRAVLQGPGDRVSQLRIGARVADWRLAAIGGNDALFVRGTEKITVPFGARAALPATVAATRSQ